MKETWKPIKGYEGYYEVSDHGRVRSLERSVPARGSKNREHNRVIPGRMLMSAKNDTGYLVVVLAKEGKAKSVRVHRLVAEAFVHNPNLKICVEVNHKDCNKENNKADNLEWVTRRENIDHAKENKRLVRTEEYKKKMHESQRKKFQPVRGTSLLTGEKKRYECIADSRADGFSPVCINYCCHGKIRQHKGFAWEYENP